MPSAWPIHCSHFEAIAVLLCHEGTEGQQRYSTALSLTSALEGVGGQRHAPAALPPGKTRYPLYRRLGGPRGRSERVQKISPPMGFDPCSFFNLGARWGGWLSSSPGRSLPRERPGTHCIGGLVGPRAGLDRCRKSRPQ